MLLFVKIITDIKLCYISNCHMFRHFLIKRHHPNQKFFPYLLRFLKHIQARLEHKSSWVRICMGVGGIFLRSLFLRIPVIELFRATLIITFMRRIKETYRLCWHYKISSDFYY